MVQLKIKGINGKFHVYMTSSYFEEELNELSTRLKIFTSQQEKMFSAFFIWKCSTETNPNFIFFLS